MAVPTAAATVDSMTGPMTDPMIAPAGSPVPVPLPCLDPAAVTRTDRSAVVGVRLAMLAAGQLQLAETFLASDVADLHAGIHQARKSIRRVRSALALGRRALGVGGRRLDAELGRLCRGLSRLRDAQALVEALQRLRDKAPRELQAILPAAEAAACQRRDRLLQQALARDPHFAARRRRLRAASLRLQRLDWAALRTADITKAAQRSERRAAKAGRRARQKSSDDESWHVFRRRLRRLHQQDSLLAALQLPVRAEAKALEHQAQALGEAQDDAMLLAHCGRRSPFTPAQRALLRKTARERLRDARGQ
ncbi:CHAD domain-containing protein [Pseudoxanthomonas gei]|uniref:CHAD domain-containing protein n=2 Tax=Pseudoxanthomonas gei TaxID=1383030 RepID=A0ABX0AI18_9GAMM|nr:CHAD domain-containing protein [Pseudoxanthomonas gei]